MKKYTPWEMVMLMNTILTKNCLCYYEISVKNITQLNKCNECLAEEL